MPHHICLYWILLRISGFMIIIILAAHTLLHPLYSIPLVSCSYLIIPWVLPVWHLLAYMLLLTTRFSMHNYDSVLSIHMCLFLHAIWLFSPLAWGVLSDSPGSLCPGHGAWSVWILPVVDQSGAAVAWIPSRPSEAPSFQAPLFGSRVFLLWLWACLCTIHTCISLCNLAIAHISDVIFM